MNRKHQVEFLVDHHNHQNNNLNRGENTSKRATIDPEANEIVLPLSVATGGVSGHDHVITEMT